MKNNILILLLISSFYNFSQSKENFDYQLFSNPDAENELSLYFNRNVSKELLNEARFQPEEKNIVLSFNINNENKPFRISINNFGSPDLRESILKAFENYPLEKLSIEKLEKKNRYSLQIISEEDGENIFNCSSKIIAETPPICYNCNDLNFYEDIKTCLNVEVEKHFYNQLNFDLLKELEDKETNLFIAFTISENGSLINNKSNVPDFFVDEVERVLKTFPLIEKISTLNDKPLEPMHSFTIWFDKDEKPKLEDINSKLKKIAKPTKDNDFATYLKSKIPIETIQKANLNRINNRLYLNFELVDNKPININTNARSSVIQNEIINAFKEYPLEKFTFLDKSKFNKQNIQILFFENNEIAINTNTVITNVKTPIFPGCKNSADIEDLKNCFSKNVQKHFSKKFNSRLPNNLGLSQGRIRVFIGFKIDKTGKIVNIIVKAPHPAIKKEVVRVMSKLPLVEPGNDSGNNVTFRYSIPFTMIVE
ncbi:MAG: hypothetical protein WAO74_00065 [Polaribacter sp.]|uniref:hypothetical protein n=1 Tax=Polaribacter sp. TaxID=1920175 RepID=UPI003BB212CC